MQCLSRDHRASVRRYQGPGRVGLSQPGFSAEAIAGVAGPTTSHKGDFRSVRGRDHDRTGWRLARVALAALFYIGTCYGAAGQGITLRYAQAYSALRSIFALPLLVAEREGFFLREGLNFSMLPVPGGGEKLVAALHDGTADICHVATPFLVAAVLKGSDAVAIAAEFNNPIYSLIAKPEIADFAALKGKLIGLADEAGTITISTRKL